MDYKVKITKDCEGDNNRGWEVDMVELFNEDSVCMAYMKLAYIPKERFESHYPNILYYMDNIKGWCGFKRYFENENWEELIIRANCHNRSIGSRLTQSNKRIITDKEWEFYGKKALKQIENIYGDSFESFKNYFVDKVYVDYAGVEEEFRGNKLYLALYKEAFNYTQKLELSLYSSSLKSDIADKTYRSYVNAGFIEYQAEYFDYGKGSYRHLIKNVN